MTESNTRPFSLGASLADQVVRYVVDAAASGELEGGQLYSVYQLADRLQISRSPVREGLLRLEEAGLIRFSRNRGFEIVPVGPQDVAEIFGMRIAVEVPAAARAARQADDAALARLGQLADTMAALAHSGDAEAFMEQDRLLHDLILETSGSRRGRDTVNRLRVATRRLGVSTVGRQRSLDQILAEHAPIVDAITKGDSEAAAAAMRDHLTRTGQLLVTQTVAAQADVAPPTAAHDTTALTVHDEAASIWADFAEHA